MCLLVNIDPNSTSANDPTMCVYTRSASRRRKASPRAIACELTARRNRRLATCMETGPGEKRRTAPDPLLNHGKHAEQNRSRQIYCCSERRLRGRHCLRVERYWVTRTARNSEARPATTNPAKAQVDSNEILASYGLETGKANIIEKRNPFGWVPSRQTPWISSKCPIKIDDVRADLGQIDCAGRIVELGCVRIQSGAFFRGHQPGAQHVLFDLWASHP